MHRRIGWRAVVVGLAVLAPGGCGRGPTKPPLGTIRIDLGFSRVRGVSWVRVGQLLWVRVAPRLGPLEVIPASIIESAPWRPPDCSPARCYSFKARRVGTATLAAMFSCGTPTAAFCAGVSARVYVEPAVCRARTVSLTPASKRFTRDGRLSVVALPARAAGARGASYRLARFFEAGDPAYLDPALYTATIDWGDGSMRDLVSPASPIGTVLGLGNGPYEVVARHFYCGPGHYTATLRLTKNGAGSFSDVTETVTVRTHVYASP